jgi:hypothetical protein
MKDKFTEYRGNKSSMRASFLAVTIMSAICAGPGGLVLGTLDIILNDGKNLPGVAMIILALAGVAWTAFTGKTAQAKEELKNEKDDQAAVGG